jgi:hypothetical protein
VWSDDFDDGNYDGWTICENPEVNPPSNWTAADNCLQIDQEDSGSIGHPSSEAYGTWSFDIKADENVVESGSGASIAIISNDINNLTSVVESEDWECYWLGFRAFVTSEGGRAFSFRLNTWIGGDWDTIDSSETRVSIGDWHHIDVIRNSTGSFSVYLNGSLVMEGVHTELTTSELFVVSLNSWVMIDNVVVNNEPIPPPTPTTPTPVDWLPIGIGVAAVVIVVVLVIFLKRR